MTKPNYTHIEMLIDRSGSMDTVRTDVIGGFNNFLDTQKRVPGEATISLSQFDENYGEPVPVVIYEMMRLQDAPHLSMDTYVPRGMTPLLDATGRTVIRLGEKLAAMPESERPSKVIVMIQTDGLENASKEFSYERVSQLIRHQREAYAWEFVFLGAGLEAAKQGVQMGVPIANVASYNSTSKGTRGAYGVVGQAIAGARLRTRTMSWTAEEKDELENTK